MPNIGPLELGIVLLVVLLIFGPKRLPGLGRSLGSGMREFRDGITGRHRDDDDDEHPRQLPETQVAQPAAQPAPEERSTSDRPPA